MSRLFLICTFLCSFTLACDLPYVEINGFKLGCPLEMDESITPYHPETVRSTYESNKVRFFDRAIISTDKDKNIVTLRFFKEYPYTSGNQVAIFEQAGKDLIQLIETFNKEWGAFELSPELTQYINETQDPMFFDSFIKQQAVNKATKSDKIRYVMLTIINNKKINTDPTKPTMLTFDLVIDSFSQK